MANVPKKVAVIGFDCAEPHLIKKHIAEGHLPNFKKLFEGGVLAENCLSPYPTITPPNINWEKRARTVASILADRDANREIGVPGRDPL